MTLMFRKNNCIKNYDLAKYLMKKMTTYKTLRATNTEMVASVDKIDIGNRARSGAKWSALQIIIRNVLSLGITAVLARMLSPGDFGLVGMVATLTALLQVFTDMGLSWATIQSQQLSKSQVNNLFWINSCVGLFLWFACIVGAPLVADFYDQYELIGITIVLGAGFLLSGIAVQPIALLNRTMNYKAIAQIEVFSILMGAITALVTAFYGLGYWVLVIQSLVSQGARAMIVLSMRTISIDFPRRGVGTRSLVNFGGLLAINGLLIYLARNLDSVLIGKYWGTTELGYYNRAYFLMLLPSMLATGVLTNLMVPSLSVFQDDAERFGKVYRRALRMITFVACPMALGLALTADEMVHLVYGDRWQSVVPLLIWLSVASITQPLYNTTGWLFTATGKAKPYLWLTVINGLILTATFFLALPGGALGIAKAYGIVMGVVIFIPAMWLAHKAAGLSLKHSLFDIYPVALCLLGMFFSVVVVSYGLSAVNISWQIVLAVKIVVGVLSYTLFSLMLMREFIKKDVLSMLKKES